ncbi:hypothetical protein BpHYR1_005548 [Brachionus plicatilis]|uniref:Uncharacterized protein n=1 Tax=Brachionus plicatilis TaxID=10195 RepID=A0A3M7SGF3_BRAPC|nr:hypothetical protein BpHYR1_005548 [Brachionus plicatilis]
MRPRFGTTLRDHLSKIIYPILTLVRKKTSLEEFHTLIAERYETEISNTSGNLTTKKDDNCNKLQQD